MFSLRVLIIALGRRRRLLLGLCLWLLFFGGLLPPGAVRASDPVPPPGASFPWASQQGQFITCLCRDGRGHLWIGTENKGLWRYVPTAPANRRYTHFTLKTGPKDDTVYALACDKQGRLWAGTLQHGVAVYNGKQWQTYVQPFGPLGLRVFAIAVNPDSGDVWIATEAGLTRYSPQKDSWTDYTHADGLPADAANALAFAPDGTLYVGTQCDGIAIGSPADDYKTWRVVPGPLQMPRTPDGGGLPSPLINCLLTTKDGAVYAGTPDGLARSDDAGRTWQYTRGADWAAKTEGLLTQAKDNLVDAPTAAGLEVIPAAGNAPVFAVNFGGPAAGSFAADKGFPGGQAAPSADAAGRAGGSASAAPDAVYKTGRVGSFAYRVSGLTPRASYRVRLHFAERTKSRAGQRVFNVLINEQPCLTAFDVFAAGGGANRPVVKEFPAQADAWGGIWVRYSGAYRFQAGKPAPSLADPNLLTEDYVTCLASDPDGGLWVGHRQTGWEIWDWQAHMRRWPEPSAKLNGDPVMALLPESGAAENSAAALVGWYADGLTRAELPAPTGSGQAPQPQAPAAAAENTPLPTPPAAPDLKALNALREQVSRVKPDSQEMQPHVTTLADDWQTEGDWLGRYGRYWACLCATFHPIPEDYLWGAGWEPVNYSMAIGPNHAPGDSLRYWEEWRYTANPHVLEMPAAYLHSRVLKGYTTWDKGHRETEVDDHGETYPQTMDGPHIYANLTIPEGLFTLSLYMVNYNAHVKPGAVARECDRDYRISILSPDGGALEGTNGVEPPPELARGRIQNFSEGVWKRFLVRGPMTLTIKLDRNHSQNTILPAIMLDLADEDPAPYFQSVAAWNSREVRRAQDRRRLTAQWPAASRRFQPAASEGEAANALFDALNEKRLTNSVWWATEGRRYYAPLLRWYWKVLWQPAPKPRTRLYRHLATCYAQMGQYQPWEDLLRISGQTTARDIEKSLRWDGVTDSYSGLGNQIVTARLSDLSGRKFSMAH